MQFLLFSGCSQFYSECLNKATNSEDSPTEEPSMESQLGEHQRQFGAGAQRRESRIFPLRGVVASPSKPGPVLDVDRDA